MSTYLRRALLRHVTGGTPFEPPGASYLALFESDPTPDNTGSEVAVAREVAPFDSDPDDNVATLTAPMAFDDVPATTITHAAQMDAAVGGNMLVYGELPEPVTVGAGTTLTLAAADVRLTFT
jgi:hypothetical protein